MYIDQNIYEGTIYDAERDLEDERLSYGKICFLSYVKICSLQRQTGPDNDDS